MAVFLCTEEGSTAETAEVMRRLLGKLQLWSRIRRTTAQVHACLAGRSCSAFVACLRRRIDAQAEQICLQRWL